MNEVLRLLRPYWRGLPVIILGMVVGVIIAKKYLSYAVPMYECTAKLKLADADQGIPGSNLFKDFDVFATSNKIAAEIEVLKSKLLIDKVLNELDFDQELYRVGKLRSVELVGNSPFILNVTNIHPKAFDREFHLQIYNDTNFVITYANNSKEVICQGILGEEQCLPLFHILIERNDTLFEDRPNLKLNDLYQFELISRQRLINRTIKGLDIIAVDKDVAVIRLNYKHGNPYKAARMINTLSEVYIEDYIEAKYKAANISAKFLNRQLKAARAKLAEVENQIQTFREEEGITNIRQETETDLRKIAQLKISQTNIKMNLDAIQYLENYIQGGKDRFETLAPNFEAFTDLLSTEIVKKIKALQAEKKDLKLIFTDEDERVKIIDEKLKDLYTYLVESISNTKKNLEIKYNKLSADIKKAEEVFIDVPENEKKMTILKREFHVYQQAYNFLHEKKIEAEIARAAKISFHRVITPAQVSKTPVSPNRTIITIVSAMLGMFVGILLVFIVHNLLAKVNDPYTVETQSSIPIALLTPKISKQNKVASHFLKSAIQLEVKGLLAEQSCICFSAFRDTDGADYNAYQLAKTLSSQGRKVLLFDVADQLSSPQKDEISAPRELQENLSLISLQNSGVRHFTQPVMEAVLDKYRQSYDLVLILNGLLERNPLSLLLMSLSQVNLIVLDACLTPEKRIMDTELLKENYQLPSMYFLLNRFAYHPGILTRLFLTCKRQIKKWSSN